MANGWSGAALSPPAGVKFVPGYLGLGTNATPELETTRLEVFAINANDGTVWHNWEIAPNGATGWSGWVPLAANPNANGNAINFLPAAVELGLPKTLAVATNQDGHLEVFAIGSNGNPYHTWQTPAGVGGWSAWTPMTAPGQPLLSLDVTRLDGQLVVAYFAKNGSLFYDFQTAPSSGPWQSEAARQVLEVALPAGSGGLFVGSFINPGQLGALGSPGLGYYLNSLSSLTGAAAADWQGWTAQAQATQTPGGWVGLPGSMCPPVGAAPDNEWVAMFNTDQNGNLAGIKFVPGDGWTTFAAYAGPGKNQTQLQQNVLALSALPIVYNQSQNGGIGTVDTQFLMAFLVDSATQKTVLNVPILCDDVADSQVAQAPTQVGISGGAVSAIAVGTNADGRLEVFALESQNQCSHWWQNAAGSAP